MKDNARKKKHTTGKMLRSMTMFGYKFEVYEQVIVLYDNEEPDKSVEMQHHTFEYCINLYALTKKNNK